ncbi:hypothetical protein GA0115259_102684, partial [Streptomyces sp. MnatMP-M17]
MTSRAATGTSRVATGIGDRLLDRALATAVARAGAPARIRV